MVGEAARLGRDGLDPDRDAIILQAEIRSSSKAGQFMALRGEMAGDHHLPDALKQARLLALVSSSTRSSLGKPSRGNAPRAAGHCPDRWARAQFLGQKRPDRRIHPRSLASDTIRVLPVTPAARQLHPPHLRARLFLAGRSANPSCAAGRRCGPANSDRGGHR